MFVDEIVFIGTIRQQLYCISKSRLKELVYYQTR
jgi:hypothetical protein